MPPRIYPPRDYPIDSEKLPDLATPAAETLALMAESHTKGGRPYARTKAYGVKMGMPLETEDRLRAFCAKHHVTTGEVVEAYGAALPEFLDALDEMWG